MTVTSVNMIEVSLKDRTELMTVKEAEDLWMQLDQLLNSSSEDLRLIVHLTAAHFGVTRSEILGPGRTEGIAWARHVAIWLARNHTTKSLMEIGRYFGDRDHGTVMHACRRVEERKSIDRAGKIQDTLERLGAQYMAETSNSE